MTHCPSLTSEVERAQDEGRLFGVWLLFLLCLFYLHDQMQRCGRVHLWLLGLVLLIGLNSGVSEVQGDEGLKHQKSECNRNEHEHGSNSTGIPIVTFKWHHVQTEYLVALFVLVAFLAKLGM